MNFTVANDPQINRQILQDLVLIREALLEQFANVLALVLVGGFGRGEGGVYRQGASIVPSNDYDIEMITAGRKGVDPAALKKTERYLADKLGIDWVHIEARSKRQLKKMAFTQYTFDIKYGHYVFYGDPHIFNLIPSMDASQMELIEGEKILFTRLWCFLGPLNDHFLDQSFSAGEQRFFANQLSKALLAVCDAILMVEGAYTLQYANKLARFERLGHLFPTDANGHDPVEKDGPLDRLVALMRWATAHKLRPGPSVPGDPVVFYFQVKQIYIEKMFWFLGRRYGCAFQDWVHFGGVFRGIPRIDSLLYKTAVGVYRRLTGRKPYLKWLLSLYLVLAFEPQEVVERYLNLAVDCAEKITAQPWRGCSWEALRCLSIELMEN